MRVHVTGPDNGVGDEGAQVLAALLPDFAQLRSLVLACSYE